MVQEEEGLGLGLALALAECLGEATTFLWMVLLAGPGQQEAHT